jgi:hypothetical protein
MAEVNACCGLIRDILRYGPNVVKTDPVEMGQ